MEPNIDRGMWSVVVLLSAIVIGGVVLIAFPKTSSKIANSMNDTVEKAFAGEKPPWVKEDDRNFYVGGKSKNIFIYSNDSTKYPIQRTHNQEYTRINRIDESLGKRVLSLYSNIPMSTLSPDFLDLVDDYEPLYISFEARTSVDTEWTFSAQRVRRDRTVDKLIGDKQKGKITTEWQQFEFYVKPTGTGWKDTELLRFNPWDLISVSEGSAFDVKLDLRNYKVSKQSGPYIKALEDN